MTDSSGQQRPSLPPELRPDHIRSYGTRRGHLTDTQRAAIESLGPQYCLPFSQELLAPFRQVFGNDNPVTLEIGCGMGETTAQVAAENPDRNYIGVEVYPAGVGALLINLAERQLNNLRLIQYDAVEVLKHLIPPASLAGVHILFPDPWPKKRHHKRRLIQPQFIELLVSRMQPRRPLALRDRLGTLRRCHA